MVTVSHGTRLPIDPWYITGFVEGEGSFTYSRSGSRRQNFVLYFGVKRSASDAAILEDLRDYFGVGNLYDVSAKATKYYRVSSTPDLNILIGHFEEHPLRGGKRACFEIWREMVRLKDENFRKPPNDRLAELALQLTAAAQERIRTKHRGSPENGSRARKSETVK